ncbi:MAG: hypothetical protein JO029_15435 [Candidatus Eremiobacteraeota bacterium]|nr:hypothetical protein [Candidatus Eremiobacteraeota bacterium]MBV8720699.1 hypothetical protein [Candidatus Eremiobacteraeota bacterium]
MPDPMEPEFTGQNPIVAAAARMRARKEVGKAVDSAHGEVAARRPEDAEESLRLFAEHLIAGIRRLNAILGERNGVKLVVLERPLRLRLRFGELRIALELDDVHQLARVKGLGLDGDYQFDPNSELPALVNLSKISTEAGYGEPLTPSSLLKELAADARLEPPSHLSGPGPLTFD